MTPSADVWAFVRAGGPILGVLICVGVALGTCLVLRTFVLLEGQKETPAFTTPTARMRFDRQYGQLRAFRRTIRTLTAIAPLLGLLGTVSGMIRAFSALARSDATASLAAGISEALITTELGLALALFGLGFGLWLERRELRLRREMAAAAEQAMGIGR